ncbi:hypothetical protein OPT61_g3850 [Boeremia exigua]|uniref:Uncharacterized protein n=1 Tax=Boeremia exigua TaxID=749465 RepID=A0ACC2IG96_9PLEO|nr:hypothetical protein OPT61_g3850 [Boeremia exigua]
MPAQPRGSLDGERLTAVWMEGRRASISIGAVLECRSKTEDNVLIRLTELPTFVSVGVLPGIRSMLSLGTAVAESAASARSEAGWHRELLTSAKLRLNRTMHRFSQFYSATEAEATAVLLQLFPQKPEAAPSFSSLHEEQLRSLLNGTRTSVPAPRKDVSQPLFRPKAPVQSVEQLLKASGFSVAHETVHRDKPVYHGSSEDSQEWGFRSRTPSSDELSPRKYRTSSPTPRVTAEASEVNNGLVDATMHKTETTELEHSSSRESHTGFHATYPQDVLQTMDTQFSKWSYDLNEGINAVPFVVAHAPTETHSRVIEIDRKLWFTGIGSISDNTVEDQPTTKTMLGPQINPSKRAKTSKYPTMAEYGNPTKASAISKGDFTSKRAAIIAKSKAENDGSLIVSKSVGQRRSAMHRNKNRRTLVQSPPPVSRKLESARETEPQTEQYGPTILLLNSKKDNQRRNVDSTLQHRGIDFENKQFLTSLMEQLGKTKDDSTTGDLEETEERSLNKYEGEQIGRLKGKARMRAKSSAAR